MNRSAHCSPHGPPTARARSKRYDVPRPDGSATSIEVCHPETGEGPAPIGPLPAVLHFHGGGYAVLGRSLPGQDRTELALCRELPAVTVVVEYRLAPVGVGEVEGWRVWGWWGFGAA